MTAETKRAGTVATGIAFRMVAGDGWSRAGHPHAHAVRLYQKRLNKNANQEHRQDTRNSKVESLIHAGVSIAPATHRGKCTIR